MTKERRDIEPGRREGDKRCGDCEAVRNHLKDCLRIIKEDIKSIETDDRDVKSRLSAIEPIVYHNQKEIDGMRKIQLGTLVSALVSAVGIIATLGFMLIQHLTENGGL